MTTNSWAQTLKERVPLETVVGGYIRLDPHGRQFRGLCPFHTEKTPSFYVTPGDGYWKCFGCGKGGDVITFIQEAERLSFPEAARLLAERFSIQLPEMVGKDHSPHRIVVRYLDQAADYFHEQLQANRSVVEYLYTRGVSDDSIALFRIGWAPDVWQHATSALKQYAGRVQIASGCALQGKQGIYDRFRSRIMFPMHSISGNTIAFSGRIWSPTGTFITERDTSGKYINSPETIVYKKSNTLYGFYQAREYIRRMNRCIVVEGHLDCVLAHQTGTRETVALCGTALTAEHAQLIRRFTDTVILALDADRAGINAMMKSVPVLYAAGLSVMAVLLPNGSDPADVIAQNANAWLDMVGQARDVIEVRLSAIPIDVSVRDRQTIIRTDVYPLVIALTDLVYQDISLQKIAHLLGVSVETVRRDIAQLRMHQKIHEPVRAGVTDLDIPHKIKSTQFSLVDRLVMLIHHSDSATQAVLLAAISDITSEYFNTLDDLCKFFGVTPADVVPAYGNVFMGMEPKDVSSELIDQFRGWWSDTVQLSDLRRRISVAEPGQERDMLLRDFHAKVQARHPGTN